MKLKDSGFIRQKRRKAFINGKIFTAQNLNSTAQSVVTEGNFILYTGSINGWKKFINEDTEIIDLKGNLMLPGFIDNHTHFIDGGLYLKGLDLRSAKSAAELQDILKNFIKTNENKWITGGNWNHENWEKRELPAKELIDPFTKNIPVFIERIDKHMALANSYALKLAGITKDTIPPKDGAIVKDRDTGEPTGIIKDSAMALIYRIIPPHNKEELFSAALSALDEAKKNGVTSIHDISSTEHLKIFQDLLRHDKLTCRIFTRLPIKDFMGFTLLGIKSGFGNEMLKIGSLKAFSDGSLGAGTAWFFDEYSDEKGNYGLPTEIVQNGDLEKWCIEADKNNLQLSIHAIGDRANSAVLDIYEKIVGINPVWDRRLRIEHAQHIRNKDIKRMKALGVIASVQPYHLIDDGSWAEKRIGKERINDAYPFKTMLNENVRLCFGSDWPVAPLKPLMGIYAAVTRSTLDGNFPQGWIPSQKISVEEAVLCYTSNNAYASFEENEKGTIQAGKLADLAVVDRDIFTIDKEEIKNTRVIMTVFDGEIIFKEDY